MKCPRRYEENEDLVDATTAFAGSHVELIMEKIEREKEKLLWNGGAFHTVVEW